MENRRRHLQLSPQKHCKGRASIELAIHEDVASHLLYDSLANAQPEPCALPVDVAVGLVKLAEVNEQFVEVLLSNTDAFVFNLNLNAH